MSNLSPSTVSAAERQFIDALADLLAAWGMPRTAGRLFAYLQLRTGPTSLDRIATDLGIGKSTAHKVARLLETQGNARRIGERGTKRSLYAPASEGSSLARQAELLGQMSAVILGKGIPAAGGESKRRLAELSALQIRIKSCIEALLDPVSAG